MARRLRDRWGSITEVRKGEIYRIRYWAETPNGYKRCSETVRGTKSKAEMRRAELMLAHGDDAPCPTVGYVWEKYALPTYESKVKSNDMSPRSLDGYMRSWRANVEPTWGEVPCDEVRPLIIQQWLSGLTLSQAKRGLQILAGILDYAVRYEFTDRNPSREKYLLPSKATVSRRDSGVWNLEELGQVWRAVIDGAQWMEPAFIVAAFGGARVSESIGILANEVSLLEVDGLPMATVPIVRQMTKEHGISDRLKTEQSKRTIVIPGKAALRLNEIAHDTEPTWPLTNNGFGDWVTRDRLNGNWRKHVLTRLPESQRHLFQNLRNSWQTNCRWTLKMQPYYIEALMGHRVAGVTGQHYDRPQVEMFVSAVAEAYGNVRYDDGWDFVPLGQIGTQG